MGEAKERWRTLCQQAINEEDPDKFGAAIEALIHELEGKDPEGKEPEGKEPEGKELEPHPSNISSE